MNVTILGTGAFGLALSKMFKYNNCNINMWTKLDYEYELLCKTHSNDKLLPNFIVDKDVMFYKDLGEAVKNANLIVIAVPVKFVRDTIYELKKYYKSKQHICIASKGIEQDSQLFISDIVKKHIKTNKIAVISGGTFAVDMINDVPLGLTLASKNKKTINLVKKCLENKFLKLEDSADVFGVEMYGAIKNVIAIAAGMIDGLNYPESTKCMFITKALNDVMNMIYAFGGNKKTILSFAGIGDLLLTCNSMKSRNYSLGVMYGRGTDINIINDYISNTTIEGLYTLKSIKSLIDKKNVDICIINTIYNIVYNNYDVHELINYLEK